jgi:uncharacterized protein YciW
MEGTVVLLHNRTIRLGLRCLIAVTALNLFGAFSDLSSHHVIAAEGPSSSEPSAQPRLEDILQQRKSIYDHIEAKTHVPWQRLAAIDQYERTMAKIPKKSAEAALHQQNNVNPDRHSNSGTYLDRLVKSGLHRPESQIDLTLFWTRKRWFRRWHCRSEQ